MAWLAAGGPVTFRRFAPSLCVAVAYGCYALLRHVDMAVYLALLRAVDGLPAVQPFGDANAVLLAERCWRLGVNVFVPNACMDTGEFNYSPFLLHLMAFPLGGPERWIAGLSEAALAVLAIALLPAATSRMELIARCFAAVSSPVVAALGTGNIDTLIFAVSAVGLAAVPVRRGVVRFGSYGLFTLLAAIKFYPVILLCLMLRENRRILAAYAVVGLGVCIAFLAVEHAGVMAALSIIPSGPPFAGTFGAINIPEGILVLARIPDGPAIWITWLLTAVALVVAWHRAPAAAAFPEETCLTFLIGGTAILVLCYFSTHNFFYRAMFFLFILPGVFAMGRTRLAAAILLLMWEPLLRFLGNGILLPVAGGNILLWLGYELLWWVVMVELAAMLIGFARGEVARLLGWGPARRIDDATVFTLPSASHDLAE